MTSIYHIIDKVPIYEKYGIEAEYEELANQLVNSGLLRIDTDDKRNFTILTELTTHKTRAFSYRELYNPHLVKETYKYFESKYTSNSIHYNYSNKKILSEIDRLKKELAKFQPVSHELELKLARLFVQSAHPIVIKWLLIEKVEVFIAYSNIIGDVMDVRTWQVAGQNSGMQSTDGTNSSIFVSCGGDPFAETNPQHPTYGDGWPAVARLQIIAAQELGHFADIIRDPNSFMYISRHSADLVGSFAKPRISQARQADIKICKNFSVKLENYGFKELIEHEKALEFFRKNNVRNLRMLHSLLKSKYYKYKLLNSAEKLGIIFIKKFSKDKYLGLMIRTMIQDMLYNLAPNADVYKSEDKEREEAIACIEALARVPQQVIKWGHLPTKYLNQNLYSIYYNEVIPCLIDTYQNKTGQPYKRKYKKVSVPFKVKLKQIIKNLLQSKNKLIYPSREI